MFLILIASVQEYSLLIMFNANFEVSADFILISSIVLIVFCNSSALFKRLNNCCCQVQNFPAPSPKCLSALSSKPSIQPPRVPFLV